MDPATLALTSLILSSIGTGGSLWSQYQAKKEAEKAAKEQAKQDAWANLMSAAGGGGVVAKSQVQPTPTVNWGGALQQFGGLLGQYGGLKSQQAEQDWLKKYQQDTLATKIPQGETSPMLGVTGVAPLKTTSRTGQLTDSQLAQIAFGGQRDVDPSLAPLYAKFGISPAGIEYPAEVRQWAGEELKRRNPALAWPSQSSKDPLKLWE